MVVSNFVNEIGNKIKIKIQKKNKDFAINYKIKEKIKFDDGVKISIIGPTSEFGANITLVEAKQLYKCLGNYLKKNEFI